MIKKTITYTDYNGEQRTDDFWFNLSEAELAEMEVSVTGGYLDMIKRIIKAKNIPEIAKVFKQLLIRSYGERSAMVLSSIKLMNPAIPCGEILFRPQLILNFISSLLLMTKQLLSL